MYANVAAVNTVLKSLALKAGDAILVYSWTYSAIRNACDATAQKSGMVAGDFLFSIDLSYHLGLSE